MPGSRLLHRGAETMLTAAPVTAVVDTTAAGDSFAAAYLAARQRGATPVAAARARQTQARNRVG